MTTGESYEYERGAVATRLIAIEGQVGGLAARMDKANGVRSATSEHLAAVEGKLDAMGGQIEEMRSSLIYFSVGAATAMGGAIGYIVRLATQ